MTKQIIVVIIFFLFFPTVVFAHTLHSDHGITATMHMDPMDDPVVGEPTNIYFEVTNTQNGFRMSDCNCFLTILEGDQIVFRESFPAYAIDLNAPVFTFRFPHRGFYTIQLSGSSLNSSFSDFKIDYDVHVEKESNATIYPTNLGQFILYGVITAVILGMAVYVVRGWRLKP